MRARRVGAGQTGDVRPDGGTNLRNRGPAGVAAAASHIHRRRLLYFAAVVVAVATFIRLTPWPPPPAANPPGALAFAALGDGPYFPWEERQYEFVIDDLNAHDLSLVVHVGDIFWRPCSDPQYTRTRERFARVRHPVLYTPGDNEWSDCWAWYAGGYSPLERLGRLRELLFADPARSLGGVSTPVASQVARPDFAEFVENARWTVQDVLFASFHLVGGHNARDPFAGRTAADDDASVRRTEAATAWLRETFAEAETTDARAVVLVFHADPGFAEPPGDASRDSYEPFISALEDEAVRSRRAMLMVHGDGHEFIVDSPLLRRATRERLGSLGRLQVPGSPDVGWVRVLVTPGRSVRFSFETRVVPHWKVW